MLSRRRFLLVGLVLLAGLATLAARFAASPGRPAPERYLTQPLTRGDIARVVNASGALQPVNLVQVGTPVSGTVRRLLVDYNSPVRAGQLLAEIDPATLDADLAQARAQVATAEANLALAQVKARRTRELVAQSFVAPSQQDEADAGVAVAQAALSQAQAAVAKTATLRGYAEIRSPVDGVVVAREVAVGQTVAASLQTPTLFRIAQDLRAMQIETSVTEADVGLLREGQAVSFTVDAFPDRRFTGVLRQIRNNHQVQSNVVTYTAIVSARNDDLSLRPGMTGYVSVNVAERQAVLRVPAAALRYEPPGVAREVGRRVWRLLDGKPEAVGVQLGLGDAKGAELLAGSLKEGDALVIGERQSAGFAGPKLF